MLTIKSSPLMSPSLVESVRTSADAATPKMRSDAPDMSAGEAWQRLIDYQLIQWSSNTHQFEDDGIEPPSRDTVQLAIRLAETLRDAGFPAPNNAVPDTNGGIVFERREKNVVEFFHVWDDGTIDYQRFHGTQLIERRPL